jgi:hypothetical protein
MAAQGHKTFTLQDNTLLLIPSNPKKNKKASRADRFLGHIFGTHNWKKWEKGGKLEHCWIAITRLHCGLTCLICWSTLKKGRCDPLYWIINFIVLYEIKGHLRSYTWLNYAIHLSAELLHNAGRNSREMNPLEENHKHSGILRVLVPCNRDDVFCVLLRLSGGSTGWVHREILEINNFSTVVCTVAIQCGLLFFLWLTLNTHCHLYTVCVPDYHD